MLAILVIAIALPFAIVDTLETGRVHLFSMQFIENPLITFHSTKIAQTGVLLGLERNHISSATNSPDRVAGTSLPGADSTQFSYVPLRVPDSLDSFPNLLFFSDIFIPYRRVRANIISQ